MQAANDSRRPERPARLHDAGDVRRRQARPAGARPAAQQTDVVRVDAEVLDVASEADRQIVSVRFHGLIREQIDGVAEPFDEIWHLVKPTDGSREWAIAGIQQTPDRQLHAGLARIPAPRFEAALRRHRRVARHGRGDRRAAARAPATRCSASRASDNDALGGRGRRRGATLRAVERSTSPSRRRSPRGCRPGSPRCDAGRLRQRHADQQRRDADAHRPARRLQRRRAGGGAARRPGGADAADRRLPARHRRLAGDAPRAQHLVRPRPARHGRAGDLLRRQGRHGPLLARRGARRGAAAERRAASSRWRPA